MKAIYLSVEEQMLLRDVLRVCISDLRVEIVGTDHWDFKRRLRERKSMIMNLLEKLEDVQAEPESA